MEESKDENGFAESASNRKHKKRNKSRFIRNAKGFGKKGIFGRGTQIEQDQYNYFFNILEALKNPFSSSEEAVTMANNVFEQTLNQEIHFSCNQIVCRVLENLISFTSTEHFERFLEKFGDDLRPICTDKFASHVLQKMIEISFLRAMNTAPPKATESNEDDYEPKAKRSKLSAVIEMDYNLEMHFKEDHKKLCASFLTKMGKYTLNNLEDFISDPYANHIIRSTVLCLTGIYSPKNRNEIDKHSEEKYERFPVSDEWKNIVREFCNRLQCWPHFIDLPYEDISSGFLGALCIALSHVDKNLLKSFSKKLLFETFAKTDSEENKDEKTSDNKGQKEEELKRHEDSSNLSYVFQTAPSVRLLDTILSCAGRKLFIQYYVTLFYGRINVLSLGKMTNFNVQKLIENVKETSDFENIFEEIAPIMEDLLRMNYTGIIFSLSGACIRLSTKQGAFMKAIQNALHLSNLKSSDDNQKMLIKCLLKLKPVEIVKQEEEEDSKKGIQKGYFIHLHGSLITQNILKFSRPINLVNSIVAIDPTELVSIFNHSNGSHIADAFMESQFIGEKSKEKLLRHLEGNYIDLACSKFGSRVIEKLFNSSSDSQKSKIAKELVEKVNLLNGSMFGRIIFSKFRLETYRLSPKQWLSAFNKSKKIEHLFKDIIEKK